MRLSFFFLSIFLALPTLPAMAAPTSTLELVYTAPVETELQAPDLRNPAEVWVEMIQSAKKSLDFEEMYAVGKAGEPLDRVLDALAKAGERGVKIRFLLDKKMLRASDPQTIEQLKKIKGLELRIWDFGALSPDAIVHAKYFVVDGGKQAYVGSQNFDWRSLEHIHETGLRLSDKTICNQIESIFTLDWKNAGLLAAGKPVPPLKNPPASRPVAATYLVASPAPWLPKGVAYSEDELVRLIGEAKKEIRVQVLDYAAAYRDKKPYTLIDNALRAAAARGVSVKLMVSHWGTEKPGVDDLKSLSKVPNIEVRIVTIPRAKVGAIPFARVNHSKIMAIDDKIAWIGTSNWSGGYLDRLRNLEIVSHNEGLAKRVAALHEQLWSSPYAAKIDPALDYPKPDRGNK